MNLHARLSSLIAARVVVSTLLLGFAILVQVNRPGAMPVDPFFFLIGMAYAFALLSFFTRRWVERHPWILDAQLGADALAERIGIDLPDDRDFATVAGLALAVLKRLPDEGESFVEQGWRFEIVDMDGHKIDKLLVSEAA